MASILHHSLHRIWATAIVLACIGSVSAVAQAKPDSSPPLFRTEPDFRVTLKPLEKNDKTKSFGATGTFWLDRSQKHLKYRFVFAGMDVIGFTGPGNPSTNDVTKMHIHEGSIVGKHVLNIYKAPSQDDDELVVEPSKGILRGVWNNRDKTVNPMHPANGSTLTLTSQLRNLCKQNLWVVVHGDMRIVLNKRLKDRVLGGRITKTRHNRACKRFTIQR